MSYSILDSVLNAWAINHGLHIQTAFKDVEVRSIDILSPAGKRFQLWLDEPDLEGDTNIHVWDMRKKRRDFPASRASLQDQLEIAYQHVKNWF